MVDKIKGFVVFIQNNFKATLLIVIIIYIALYKLIPSNENKGSNGEYNSTKIKLSGVIMNSTEVVEKIREATEDKKIKGIMMEINSPGGSVPPSIEIALELKHAKEKGKKVVVYANGLLASGSYYASIYADKIVSNPGSIIGSIGVITKQIDAQELLKKIGIKVSSIKAGKYKEMGAPYKNPTPYETKELTKMVENIYNQFVNDVANARKLNKQDYKKFADAKIFTAREALKIGLIDKIGIEYNAKNELKKLIKTKKIVFKKQKKNNIDNFVFRVLESSLSFFNIKLSNVITTTNI